MVRCGEGMEMPLRRPLSLHRIEGESLALLFAVVGRGTEWLAGRKEGDSLDLFGPLGNGFDVYPSSRKLLLVAGGLGIAPLAALAEQGMSSGRSVELLIGAENIARIYPDELIPRGIQLATATEDGSKGHMGMVTDLLSLPGLAAEFISEADQIFVCGPLPMYRALAEMGTRLGDKPTQVLLEAVLGCGVGACLSCTVETRRGRKSVCKDGPVFEFGDIVWDEMVAPPAGRRY
jgi:dihydroorotate dehydrogenase electron transfer subunit